jgi:hydroxycarboxylate dehydrogenase B
LPFGGDLGYRGFALGLLVETMGGLIAGTSSVQPLPGNGLCLIVINVAAFLPPATFGALTQELREYVKSCPPDENHREITMPGELDFRVLQERTALGIPIDLQTWDQLLGCAASVGVAWSDVSAT